LSAWCRWLAGFLNFAPAQLNQLRGIIMKTASHTARTTALVCAFAAMAAMTVLFTGCAVVRGQETTGAYVDDAGITTTVKARMVEDKTVSASSISVETLNGTVQLSGFAKSTAEKSQAESIARNVKNVRSVRNDIVVRP
jgi:osmotically-inducible protein OsmY